MDPLAVLRDFAIRGELNKIVRVGDEFHFGGEFRFPCTAGTAYRSMQGSLYSLDVLVYFLQNHHLKHPEYILACRRHGVSPVTLPDRRPLLEYLFGKVSFSDCIQFAPPEEYRPDEPQFHQSDPDRNGAAAAVGFDLEAAVVADGYGGDGDEADFRVRDSAGVGGVDVDAMAMILESERPLRDRNSLLVCKNRNFFSVYAAAMEREEKRKRMDSQQRKDGLVAKNRLMRAGEERGMGGYGVEEAGFDSGAKSKMMKTGKIGEGVPIILVPSASHTLITIYNVKEFLEDGVFIPTDVKMRQMNGPKPDCVTVQKKFGRDKDRAVQAYEVRDKPSSLKTEDWDRVVGVFVLGKEWQFKAWPFKDHVEIFNRIIGFFMRFEDDSVESAKTVKQWNVKIISISKNKRHQDRAAALEVWERLEEFMQSRSRS